MSESMKSFAEFAVGRAPFRSLEPDDFEYLLKHSSSHNAQPGTVLLEIGDDVDGLYVLTSGNMELKSPEDEVLQHMYAGDVFGHRSLLRGSGAIMRVVAKENSSFVIINADAYRKLMASNPVFASFFSRTLRPSGSQHGQQAITPTSAVTVGDVMTRTPIKVHLGTSIRDCAELMAARNVSCMLVTDEDAILKGILTSGDLVKNVIVGAVSAKVPIEHVMTTSLTTCRAEDTVMRAIIAMTENRIAHLPVTNKQGKLVGIVTQTDLVRRNSNSLIFLINNISKQTNFDGLASIVARKPLMLAELVGSGAEGHQILRLMTSISDAITKRLIQLAIEKLGEPPVSWL
ncbi:MAG: CBS domain-containing protein, partial [Pseudomonadota bacterium]